MAEPKVRFKKDDGSSYPAWNNKCFGDLFKKNNERNGNQFSEDRTISIASMSFNPNGNGADTDSLSVYKVLRVGDVAFEGHENKEFSHGRFVMNDIGDGIMSPRFSCMRPIVPMVSGFWKYYIHSEVVMRDILIRSTKKGTMMHELVFEDLFKQSIDVPCLEEQQKIADFLSSVDEVISTSEQEVANLETQKKAVMKKLFSQEVRFKRNDGTDFPGWEGKKLGDVGTVLMCKRVFKEQTDDEGDIPFYKIGTFGGTPDAYISQELFDELKAKYSYPKKGNILLSAAGTIGRAVVYNGEDAYYQDSNIVWLDHDETLSDEYLFQFYSMTSWDNLEGGTVKRLYNGILLDKDIGIPCLEEQHLIADFLSDFDEAIAAAKKELELWKELKKGLLQQMFV